MTTGLDYMERIMRIDPRRSLLAPEPNNYARYGPNYDIRGPQARGAFSFVVYMDEPDSRQPQQQHAILVANNEDTTTQHVTALAGREMGHSALCTCSQKLKSSDWK